MSVCRRTILRKAFLAPWHPLVNDIWLYSLADAARETGVSIHMSRLVVNHHHTQVTPSRDNLPEFWRRVHSDVSCALNELLLEHGYDKPRQIWDGRGPHYLRLLDGAAQISQLVYDEGNQVAAGMVERVEHMPDRQLTFGMWATEGLAVAKPPVFFDKTRASELQCNPEPNPEVMRTFEGDLEGAIHHMRKLARHAQREVRSARTRPAMGAQKLRRMHPFDEPRTLAEPGGERVPTFRIGLRGESGRELRIAASKETTAFRRGHAETRERRLQGEDIAFPYGTYGQRVFHGAPVSEADVDALLAQPGPLLTEVMAELESEGREPVDRKAVLERVREALVDEAPTLVEESELDFRKRELSEASDGERPEPETVHRLDPKRGWQTNPRRLIVRRDARRGRPQKKQGSDPPCG